MKQTIAVWIWALGTLAGLRAQEAVEYRVELKEGTTVRGYLEGDTSGAELRLRFSGGALLVLKKSEIGHYAPETAPSLYKVTGRPPVRISNHTIAGKKPYFRPSASLGFTDGRFEPEVRAGIGLSAGYRIMPELAAGGGINLAGFPNFGGIAQYYGEAWGNIGKGKIAFYYETQAGTGSSFNRNWNVIEFTPGFFFLTGAGITLRSFFGNEMHFSLAYSAQNAFLRYQEWDWWTGNQIEVRGNRTFRHIALRYSFTF